MVLRFHRPGRPQSVFHQPGRPSPQCQSLLKRILVATTLLSLFLYAYWLSYAHSLIKSHYLDLLGPADSSDSPKTASPVNRASSSPPLRASPLVTSPASDKPAAAAAATAAALKQDKFIIFIPINAGQGAGNILAGLLSAHLLALESDRIVCVDKRYTAFYMAFEAVHPDILRACPDMIDSRQVAKNYPYTEKAYVRLINFEPDPNECRLKETIFSNETVLYMEGNTYPRWPPVPDNFFFTYYKAKQELLEILPFKSPPHTVVHLRVPDGYADVRKGLEPDTLKLLGETLPKDSYLVTNQVGWYKDFETNYGWSHPQWDDVVHSALGIRWKSYDNQHPSQGVQEAKEVDRDQQTLFLMADWYTMLTAKMVYHTHSDFSLSAIHWMNVPSFTVQGSKDGKLKLDEEYWRIDPPTPFLKDRTVGGRGNTDLRLCDRDTPVSMFDIPGAMPKP
jgi:hypothetical protein